MAAELDNAASNRDFVRSVYSSIFTQTIGIDCLYKLEGKTVLTVAEFDRFYYILGTIETLSIRRLLELTIRLRKRTARLKRSYNTGIGASSNTRDRISAKYDNPNLEGDDNADDKATLARRNGKLQRPIQQQANRRAATPSNKAYCNCLTSYVYGRYACLKAKQLYNARCKYKGYLYKNKFGTILERLLTAALARLLSAALARLLSAALARLLSATSARLSSTTLVLQSERQLAAELLTSI